MGLFGHSAITHRLQHAQRFAAKHKIAVCVPVLVVILIIAVVTIVNNDNTVPKQTRTDNPVVSSYRRRLPELKQKVVKEPNNSSAHTSYAEALYITGNKSAAITEYETALKITPDSATNQNNVANAYRDIGNFTKATAAYQKAITLQPTDQKAYLNLANMQLYSQQNPAQAINTYQSAIRSLGASPQIQLLLGLAYEQNKNIPEAKATYNSILSTDPNNLAAKNNLKRLGD